MVRGLDEVPTTDAPGMVRGDEDPEAHQATERDEEDDEDQQAEDAPFEEVNL